MKHFKRKVMGKKNIGFFVILVLFLGSCSTSPDFVSRNYPGVVFEEGEILFYFNLSEDRIILEKFLVQYTEDDLSALLDRSERVSFSLNGLDSNSEFVILAEGNFPRIFTNWTIGRKNNWVRHKDKYVWWENSIGELYASVPLSSVAIISNDEIHTSLEFIANGNRHNIPENVKAEFEQSAVTIYSHLPGESIYESLNIPLEKMFIQDLFFMIKKVDEIYSIFGVMDFQDQVQAKVFSTALKLSLLISVRKTGKAGIMKIVQEAKIEAKNSSIFVEGIYLNSEELSNLLSSDNE
jgi:hypothetical protein